MGLWGGQSVEVCGMLGNWLRRCVGCRVVALVRGVGSLSLVHVKASQTISIALRSKTLNTFKGATTSRVLSKWPLLSRA